MTDLVSDADESSVLALVLHPRYSGNAVIDRWGLVPNGLQSWDLRRHRSAAAMREAVEKRLRRSLRHHRPGLVVLGVSRRDDARSRALRLSAERMLRGLRVRFVVRSVADGRRLLVGRIRGRRRGELTERLTRGFFPELAFHQNRSAGGERYRRHGWHALALAILEMARRHPRPAFAMARSEAFEAGTFVEEVARADRRLNPDP
jgi:hypothetical protein